MGLGVDDFAAVLAGAQAGDERAWRRLYDSLSGGVRGFLFLQRAPDPDDVLGDVFLDVARNISSFEGTEANFRAWVFTIAHHRLVDARRRSASRPADPTDNVELDGRTTSIVARATSVEDFVLHRAGTLNVQHLLEQLAPDQQVVLTLEYLGGLTIKEIAGVVGKNPNAVKALHRRGLLALRRLLAIAPSATTPIESVVPEEPSSPIASEQTELA